MRKFFTLLIALLVVAYPFVVYAGLHLFSIRYVSLALIILLCARVLLSHDQLPTKGKWLLFASSSCGIIICGFAALSHSSLLLRLYPVAINLVFFCVFLFSLYHPPTMIEYFARRQQADLPPAAIAYTRKLTKIWVIFFLVNGLIAFFTCCWAPLKLWMLYNGFIAYLLIGALLLGEYVFRRLSVKIPTIKESDRQ